jgi:hypothetical protein
LVEALTRVYNRIPLFSPDPETECGHRAAVLTSDHLLDVPWAVTVSGPEHPDGGEFLGVGYRIKGRCIRNEQDLIDFAVQHQNTADNGEDPCVEGDYIP